ncbi:hypothetical protein [Vibrio splendidus]|uniref:hypothetical protein n=1 Tax=Vibrio splendidus TaxID=29497 RepID=UPI000C851FB3|nr:hypothetical protein [Vibrio splendidus]PMI27666.1 hypothetical protein BCU63_29570 [Vibrio splendidus]PMJ71674.1 hypothetical protein BCU23_01965 [Vibrio splendidus]
MGLEGPVEIAYKSGRWTCNPEVNQGQLYGADGSPQRYKAKPGYAMPQVNEGALVGRISDSTFFVGRRTHSPSNLSGNIELCINDDLEGIYGKGLTDNEGALNVVVTRTGYQ